jgi:hypothetical protein
LPWANSRDTVNICYIEARGDRLTALSAASRVTRAAVVIVVAAARGVATLLSSLMGVDLALGELWTDELELCEVGDDVNQDVPPVPTRLSGVPSCLRPSCSEFRQLPNRVCSRVSSPVGLYVSDMLKDVLKMDFGALVDSRSRLCC